MERKQKTYFCPLISVSYTHLDVYKRQGNTNTDHDDKPILKEKVPPSEDIEGEEDLQVLELPEPDHNDTEPVALKDQGIVYITLEGLSRLKLDGINSHRAAYSIEISLNGCQTTLPVSYTHLDVYKRQMYSSFY